MDNNMNSPCSVPTEPSLQTHGGENNSPLCEDKALPVKTSDVPLTEKAEDYAPVRSSNASKVSSTDTSNAGGTDANNSGCKGVSSASSNAACGASPLRSDGQDEKKGSKSKRINGCWLSVAILLIIFFSGFIALIVYTFLGADTTGHAVRTPPSEFSYRLLGSTACTDLTSKIVVLPIRGSISSNETEDKSGFCNPETLNEALDFIDQDTNVDALVLLIDSPGGGLTASDMMYHSLMRFKKQHDIPIYAYFEDMACSGGYYIAMAADSIYACPTTMTGSIGVIISLPEISGLMDKVGVKMNTITSLNYEGKESYKDIGSMFRAMKPQERAILQNIITESWHRFVDVVAKGRKGKLTLKQVEKLADGRILSAQQALKAHIIDEICYPDELYDRLMRKSRKTDSEAPRAVMLQRSTTFMDKFSIMGLSSWMRPVGMVQELPQTVAPNRYLLSPVSASATMQ